MLSKTVFLDFLGKINPDVAQPKKILESGNVSVYHDDKGLEYWMGTRIMTGPEEVHAADKQTHAAFFRCLAFTLAHRAR